MIFELVSIALRLAAIRDQWRRVIAAQIEEKPELK